MQGLVETLLLTPATWEITLVVLAIAITSDNQSARGTPDDDTSNSRRSIFLRFFILSSPRASP
eukprot:1454385-Pyramimonas_sp.AAC.1